jgi:hypothetical protein
MRLYRLQSIPEPLLTSRAQDLHQYLPGPTLIEWGEGDLPPVFISLLLHGNETSGFSIAQNLWKKLLSGELVSRHPLIFFIGNIEAAAQGMRHLPTQLDMNRIWSGGAYSQAQVAQEVLQLARERGVGWAIDLHNNTGKNPLYACMTKLEPEFWQLAHFFSPHIVYFTEPHEVLAMALSDFCTSVIIEAGLPGEIELIDILTQKLECLLSQGAPNTPPLASPPPTFRTTARFRVAPSAEIDFRFDPSSAGDLSLRDDLADYNFQKLETGFLLGFMRNKCLWLENHFDEDFTHEYLEILGQEIRVKKSFTPSMFTKDIVIIKSDCLGYVMEEMPLSRSNQ